MRILLVGGGTAGHLFPLVAVAKELQKCSTSIDLHFAVAQNNSDKYIVENAGYQYTEFSIAKLRRYFSWENIRDFFRFFRNIVHSAFFLSKYKPDIVFSKGGFVSLPLGLSAKLLGIPFILHETDTVMGLSNRILSKFATRILTGFPSNSPGSTFVGNPVREEFFEKPSSIEPFIQKDKKAARNTKNPLKILIFGGSQGAQALNTWARAFFKDRSEDVLLITGKGKMTSNHLRDGFEEVEFLSGSFPEKIHQSDIVITRAGGSVAELAAAKKMVVLVPLPSAANNHQRKNAAFFAEKNAALSIEESDLFTDTTSQILEEIFTSRQKRDAFEKNISAFAKLDAARIIAELLLEG